MTATSATGSVPSTTRSSTSSTTSDLRRQRLCGSVIPAYGLRGYISVFVFILVAIHRHSIDLGISNIDRETFCVFRLDSQQCQVHQESFIFRNAKTQLRRASAR